MKYGVTYTASVVHGHCTFKQSSVVLIRNGKRKNDNTHIQVTVRECCTTMDGKTQQNQRPKVSGPKKGQQAKKSTKRNLATGQKEHFKSIWLDKVYSHKNESIQTVNKKGAKRNNCVNFIRLDGPQ